MVSQLLCLLFFFLFFSSLFLNFLFFSSSLLLYVLFLCFLFFHPSLLLYFLFPLRGGWVLDPNRCHHTINKAKTGVKLQSSLFNGFCALTDYMSVDPKGCGVSQQEARHQCAYIAEHGSRGENRASMKSHRRRHGITFPALPLSTSFISQTLFLLLGSLLFSPPTQPSSSQR